MNPTDSDLYPTSDLLEIVYLFCGQMPLARTERQGQRVIFYFQGRENCRQFVADINYGRDMVRLSSAIQEIRRARDLMHKTP